MAHFYADIKGCRGEASRLGSKASGIIAHVASWAGSVRVSISHDEKTGEDWACVSLEPWHNGAGVSRLLYSGPVSGKVKA